MMCFQDSKPHIAFYDNKQSHCWIVISGWGILAEFMIKPPLASNMLYISDYNPFTLKNHLKNLLSTYAIKSYSVLGISMGGLWLSQHQSLFSNAQEFIYLGIRDTYTDDVLQPIVALLHQDLSSCLSHFYRNCCATSNQANQLIQNHKLHLFNKHTLLEGLNFLKSTRFHVKQSCDKVRFFHGALDRISPVKGLKWINPNNLTIVQRKGHLFSPWN